MTWKKQSWVQIRNSRSTRRQWLDANEQIGDFSHSSLAHGKDKIQNGQQWIHLQTSSGRTESSMDRGAEGERDGA